MTVRLPHSEVQALCPTEIDDVCNYVGQLPPYVCTRKRYQDYFTALSSAIANTQLFLSTTLLVTALYFDYGNQRSVESPKLTTVQMTENIIHNQFLFSEKQQTSP